MRFNHFHEIVQRIHQDVPCPRCQSYFDEQDIEVQDATKETIDFVVNCQHCNAEILISAHIQQTRIPNQKVFNQKRQHQGIKISPHWVQEISQTLRNFRGHDVRELF